MIFTKLKIFTLLLLFLGIVSCKKELSQIKGRYTGTVRYVSVNPQNPFSNKDTLYTNVSVEVKEGEESSRKKLTVEVVPSVGSTSFNDNIPINNGMVNYTRTTVQAGMYYRWNGEIKSDSLRLTYTSENSNNSSYDAWIFAARK